MRNLYAMTLPDLVRVAMNRLGIESQGLVVGVSGGADSVALIRAMHSVPQDRTCAPLIIAHLNHQLRGAESDADESFVRNLHSALPGTRLEVERRDVRAILLEQGGNLEAAARAVRYSWFAEVARRSHVRFVATAHTRDDQAETVMHRLLRGTGLQGLRGIAARRPLNDEADLVRPLLGVSRCQVVSYLRDLRQDYRTDSSNLDLSLTRNRIRHELLPRLAAEFNPDIHASLAHLATQANAAFEFVEQAAAQVLAEAELPRAGDMIILDRVRLCRESPYMLGEALRLLWRRSGWPVDGMRAEDWERVVAVARGEITAVDLPGRIHARARDRVLQIHPTRLGTIENTTAENLQ